MKNTHYLWALAVLLAGLLSPVLSFADARRESISGANVDVPWYVLPGRFLFQGSYYTHLNLTEMRIDHVSDDSRCTKRNRAFMIAASFAQPVGNLFQSRFELPFLSADRLSVTRLAPASVGDYVIHLSNSRLLGSVASLVVAARF